jgi:hypothetical protein
MKPVTSRIGRPHTDVIARQMGDGAVLVHLATNTIFELNRTGARVWELLGQGVTSSGIAAALVEEFQVEIDRASREVDDLIERLIGAGLLEP